MKNKKGQLAMLIIAVIIIVAGILLFFFLQRRFAPAFAEEFEPKMAIEKCARDSVNEAVEIMLPQGGFIEPQNFKLYNNTKITYLCENIGYFKPCINQHPMLLNEMKNEIYNYAKPKVETCFDNTINELKRRNYEVEAETMKINVSLGPGKVYLPIERKMRISKGEQIRTFEKFDIEVLNPIYDLGNVAIEIASNEAKYCYFENVGYGLMYSQFNIEKWVMSDSTKIYMINDKKSGKTMNIAIRGCAIPAGI